MDMVNKMVKMGKGLRDNVSCALCGKELEKADPKFVLASKEFNASNLSIDNRMLCMDCYTNIAVKNKRPTRSSEKLERTLSRDRVRHGLAKEMMYSYKK